MKEVKKERKKYVKTKERKLKERDIYYLTFTMVKYDRRKVI